MLQTGTYLTERGELLHYRHDVTGAPRCEVERVDGSRRAACEICDGGVLLSDDPEWPWRDPRTTASLFLID